MARPTPNEGDVSPAAAPSPEQRGRPSPATYTRRRLLVAAATLAIPAAALAQLRRADRSNPATQPPSSTTSSTTSDRTAVDDPGGGVPNRVAAEPLSGDLALGAANDDVGRMQARLTELRFDPGPVDGYFGPATRSAVWGAEKLLLGIPRSEATGIVTATTWEALNASTPISPRRSSGGLTNHSEIYLPEQAIAVFHGDEAVLVSHMASGELDDDGEPAEWCEIVTIDTDSRGNRLDEPVERDICGRSKTPGGVFEYDRRVVGWRNGALGSMWNPVYFNYGIAVHGGINVPLHPVSHGCVRIPMHIADYFPDLVADGDRVLVWNGELQPEEVSGRDSLPVFDYANPNATTTTSSTSTTTPTAATTTSTTSTTTTTTPVASTTTIAGSATTTPPADAP